MHRDQLGPVGKGRLDLDVGDHLGDTVQICKDTGATLVANFEVATYLAGKGVATLAAVAITAGAAVGAGLLTAWIALTTRDAPQGPGAPPEVEFEGDPEPPPGAVAPVIFDWSSRRGYWNQQATVDVQGHGFSASSRVFVACCWRTSQNPPAMIATITSRVTIEPT